MRHVRYLLLLTVVSLAPALAFAGEQANAPSVTGETGLFTLLSGDTLPRGGWDFGLYFNNWDPVIKLDPGQGRHKEESLDWSRLSASFGYGITDRWEVSVMVPYEDYNYDEGDLLATDHSFDDKDFGNVRVGTKWRLAGGPGDHSRLALNAFAELPTGKDTVASKDTGFGAGLDWSVGNWVLNAGYADYGKYNTFSRKQQGTVGIGYAAPVSERFDWITEVDGIFYSGGRQFDTRGEYKDRYDFTIGGRLWFGSDQDWAFNFGLRTDLAQLNTIDEHCPLGGLAGFTYYPRMIHKAE
ncbi:MAG TPA: hypothetical protein VGK45_15845, partial [Thermoanaerobaculia bacterium]